MKTRIYLKSDQGSALILTLVMILLATILVVTLALVVTNENKMARLTYNGQQADLFSELALDAAQETIATNLAQFDDPFTSNTPASNFWSVAPGRISIYPLLSGSPRPVCSRQIDLFSGAPYNTNNGTALPANQVVDLNAPCATGVRPINSALDPSLKMNVAWVSVLANPSQLASSTNQIIGRYAYWVDDEGAKVNVNTADGSEKYDGALSYGPGTPTEVTLGEIGTTHNSALNTNQIISAATRARTGGFATPGELSQIPGIPSSFQTTNNFTLTAYSRAPEFSIFNEPRLQLAPSNLMGLSGNTDGSNPVDFPGLCDATTYYTFPYPSTSFLSRAVLRSVYPFPSQISNNLKTMWPILPNSDQDTSGFQLVKASILESPPLDPDAALWAGSGNVYTQMFLYAQVLQQTAQYLLGYDGKGNQISWPFTQANYTSKYNARQIDSITLQLLDQVHNSSCTAYTSVSPTLALYGISKGQDLPVFGIGRNAKFTQFYGEFSLQAGEMDTSTPPKPLNSFFRGSMRVELYYPAGSFTPNHIDDSNSREYESGYDNAAGGFGTYGSYSTPPDPVLNSQDGPRKFTNNSLLQPSPGTGNGSEISGAGGTNSFWMDNLLVAKDQAGNPAGIDFWGNRADQPDPDQTKAALYHSMSGNNSGTSPYYGEGAQSPYAGANPLFWFNSPYVTDAPGSNYVDYRIRAGSYAVTSNQCGAWSSGAPQDYPTHDTGNQLPAVQSITLSGNIFLWLNAGVTDVAPISSLVGPKLAGIDPANPPRPYYEPIGTNNAPYVSGSGLPLPPNLTIAQGQTVYVDMTAADPFVNKNVGDWNIRTLPGPITMGDPATRTTQTYAHTNVTNPDSVDMAACWTTRNYARPVYNNNNNPNWFLYVFGISPLPFPRPNWSTQASFPSIAPLHYIRTKMMPDTGSNAGVPFRCLSLAPSTDPTQSGIPDWAMLDLFTVPQGIWRIPASNSPDVLPTPNYSKTSFFGGDYINLTYAGATSGKINVNGGVLYPWANPLDTTSADQLPYRLDPIASVFTGLKYNRDGTLTFDSNGNCTSLAGPLLPADSTTISQAIANYIKANGPFSMPGEICDVQTLTDMYGVNAQGLSVHTRNDVIAQALGNLTTQSNVFSVWVAAESVRKVPTNISYGTFESGDVVLAMSRKHFIIERYLQTGPAGVPGNAANPGPDGFVGTLDDPVDPINNPPNPKFKYRVIYAESIR